MVRALAWFVLFAAIASSPRAMAAEPRTSGDPARLTRIRAAKMPAILFAAALLVMQAAVNVLAVAVCLWLLPMVGPLLAGLIAFLIFAAGAGLLGWLGVKKIKEAS